MHHTLFSLVLIAAVMIASSFAMPLSSGMGSQGYGSDSPKFQSVASRLRGSGSTAGNGVIRGGKPKPRPPPPNKGGFGSVAGGGGNKGKNGNKDPKSESRVLDGTTDIKEEGSVNPESQSIASRLRGSRGSEGTKVTGGAKPKPRPPPPNKGRVGSTADSRKKIGGGDSKSQSVASRLRGSRGSVSRVDGGAKPKPRPPPSNMGGFGSTTGTGKNDVSRPVIS